MLEHPLVVVEVEEDLNITYTKEIHTIVDPISQNSQRNFYIN